MTASGEESLYDLLGVDRTASKGEIRRAYHRLAVVCHPDRHPEDEHAQERYDALQHIKVCARAPLSSPCLVAERAFGAPCACARSGRGRRPGVAGVSA